MTYTALTIIVTMGSQASGETGLNNWISGLNAALMVVLDAAEDADGHGDQRRQQESGEHGLQAGEDLVDVGGLAGVLRTVISADGIFRQSFGIALFLALVEGRRPFHARAW